MKRLFFILICLVSVNLSARSGSEKEELPFHRRTSSYPVAKGTTLEERIVPIPDFTLEWIRDFDKNETYQNHSLSAEELTLFSEYSKKLPPLFTRSILESVIGIYFIDNLTGGGMTLDLYDEEDNLSTVLFLNADIMGYTLSEWLIIRDSSPFIPAQSYDLIYQTGDENAILYILLHEMSHIFDFHNSIIYPDFQNPEFTRGVWEEMKKPAPEITRMDPRKLHFYGWGGDPEVPVNEAEKWLEDLKETPLTTIYSASSALEDFAEFSSWYLYTYYFGGNISVGLRKDGKWLSHYSISEKVRESERVLYFQKLYGAIP